MSVFELNRMMYDLREPTRREELRRDVESYLDEYELTEAERKVVLARDWQGMVDAGASIYVMTKLGAVLEVSLYEMGAQMRNTTVTDFWSFVSQQNEANEKYVILPDISQK